jgi:hypothetical protein
VKFRRHWASAALLLAAFSVSSVAKAALVANDGGLIYDAHLNTPSKFYWTATNYAQDFNYDTRTFNSHNGRQDAYDWGNGYYVWAMRPDNVAAVPHPAACWLFGSGLIGLFGIVRRKTT